MGKNGKVITLPSAEEIMARLEKIDMGSGGYMSERFYPLIAEEGGRELVASGVVMMLTLKIYDFVHSGYPPMMEGLMHLYVPIFIDALIDDKEVAEEAKRLHKEATDAAYKGKS